MDLDANITTVKGVGPALTDKLQSIGIYSVGDFLDYLPRKYDDYSEVVSIGSMSPGLVTLSVKFVNVKTRRVRRGLHITDADAVDESGRVKVVWFNQPYRAAALKPNTNYLLHGNYDFNNNRLQIVNPSAEIKSDIQGPKTIVATYPERLGLKSHQLRKIVSNIIKSKPIIKETLPVSIIKNYKLASLEWSYKQLHQPESNQDLLKAKHRFAFEELFIVMLAAAQLKLNNKSVPAQPVEFIEKSAKDFVANLPFKLTDSQRAIVWKIYQDMASETPMNRLVEGDVGSGKTVVAAMAALMALEAGQQVAFIAPTEILANQHFSSLKNMLAHTNHASDISLLTGSVKASQKKLIKQDINTSQAKLIVGTHALLQESVNWSNLGLVIIDEQHRFGVNQRQSLHTKAGHMPHVLCLTATPIPRSLALTVYGELDISILNQPPAIRAGVNTSLISPNSTTQMYESIELSLDAGRQAYVVCPLISESDKLAVASAEEIHKKLSQKEFKNYNVGLLHGRMKGVEKDQIMTKFIKGEIDVLVSTTVIEVGVDVKNATEMVILGADRFGLAQLHQLRGRVGRGEHKGHCYLVMSDSQKPSRRMQAVANTSDGFKLAEYDMEIRGPGAIYGIRQSGELDLRYVSLTDHKLIAEVRDSVNQFIKSGENMLKYKKLQDKLNRTLKLTYLN